MFFLVFLLLVVYCFAMLLCFVITPCFTLLLHLTASPCCVILLFCLAMSPCCCTLLFSFDMLPCYFALLPCLDASPFASPCYHTLRYLSKVLVAPPCLLFCPCFACCSTHWLCYISKPPTPILCANLGIVNFNSSSLNLVSLSSFIFLGSFLGLFAFEFFFHFVHMFCFLSVHCWFFFPFFANILVYVVGCARVFNY